MAPDIVAARRFFAALQAAGLPEVPRDFSVVPCCQVIPDGVIQDIARFIDVFDAVTARDAWRAAASREAPPIAAPRRRETCFFSAWDFHLPPGEPSQLIEFNDNGSGFLLAGIINAVYHENALAEAGPIAPPADVAAFATHIARLVDQEAAGFWPARPAGMLLILDDEESLRDGKFRAEHGLLRDILNRTGWRVEIGCPGETRWDRDRLLFDGEPVAFIVNRSTDFFFASDEFSAVRAACAAGEVYIAPNPFTYATRSDKRLLAWLALPDWDTELGIQPDERRVLSAHVPETHLIGLGNADALADRKTEFAFKPLHGFAGRGLLDRATVGRARLRRIARHGEGYVAQRWVAKPVIDVDGASLWTDLRVWAYRGRIFNISGRASRRPDRLDLTPPGGWLPTYVTAP